MPLLNRAAFRPLAVLSLLVAVLCGAAPAAIADQPEGSSAHRFELGSGLSGLIDFQGGLVFQSSGSRLPFLTTELVSVTDARRRRPGAAPFFAVVVDGAEHGQRGFSSRADDDQDGQTDEDRLDGIDNDLDGSIDEDFAAIGDAMAAVHLQPRGTGRTGTQLEYYHWSALCLNSAVFLNAVGGKEARDQGTYRLQSSGPRWLETEVRSVRHDIAGRPESESLGVFVCRVSRDGDEFADDPCLPGTGLWLGVMILDQETSTRFKVEGDRLELPLSESPVPLVVCAAESWLQLNRLLGEARHVYEGVVDPVDNRRERWIPPPGCTACRAADPFTFVVKTRPGGGLTLTTEVHPGQCGLMDPDLFHMGDYPLGTPMEIRWLPTDGEARVIPWSCMTPERIEDSARSTKGSFVSLAELLDHKAGGRLEFDFDTSLNVPADVLDLNTAVPLEVTGRYFDGRIQKFSIEATPEPDPEPQAAPAVGIDLEPGSIEETARGYAEDRERLLKSGNYQPSLSPELLMGWPNPFNDIISIRFTVPRTMKEAFIWKSQDKQPLEIELEGDVPWSGGQPGVSVKIYSINGQELVTIHSGTEGPGEYTAQWNGTDAFGRKVASGTYFCKLQLDDWSVTRRLVFIR